MSSIPDIVQTSQYKRQSEDDDESVNVSDVDKDEFFLSKNSRLFSQVSSNSLKTSPNEEKTDASDQEMHCQMVEVKEMEIVKAVAAPSDDRVVLPRANFGVQQVPQVVERVEIVEDTETEAESIDTDDPDEIKSSTEEIIAPTRKELVSILKRNTSTDSNQKDLSALLDEALKQSPASYLQKSKPPLVTSTPQVTKTRIDTESVAEYLILDDGESMSNGGSIAGDTKKLQNNGDGGVKKKVASVKEVTFAKGSPIPKRTKVQEIREDCDSFYGSDKETDDVLIFSDDTEIDVGSSSSEEGEAHGDDAREAGQKDVLNKVARGRGVGERFGCGLRYGGYYWL